MNDYWNPPSFYCVDGQEFWLTLKGALPQWLSSVLLCEGMTQFDFV